VVGNGGTLSATGTTFTSGQLTVNSGGTLSAVKCTFGLTNLTLNNSASAALSLDSVSGVFTINSGAFINIANNDFSKLTNPNGLVAAGSSTATINLENNYWGTTNLSQIDLIVDDHADNNTLPTVDYSNPLATLPNQNRTATTLASTANPSVFGQTVNLTAIVSVSLGSGVPTGSVTFEDGTTTLGTVTLNSGVATFTTAALAVGTHSITAVYSGDATFTASTSASLPQTVNQDASVSVLVSSVNPSVSGEKVTFFVIVQAAAPGAGTPTGTVTFLNGSSTLGTATLNASGVAAFTTTTLTVGNHSITVSYGGDANFTASTSAALTQTVNKDATTTTVTSSNNPAVFGQTITFTAIVKASWPGSGLAGGTVTFKDGGVTIGTATLSGGKATFTTSTLAVGNHTITAVYSGNANFKTSTSAAITQTVTAAAGVSVILPSVNLSIVGQPVSFSAGATGAAPAPLRSRGPAPIWTQALTAGASGPAIGARGEDHPSHLAGHSAPGSLVWDPQGLSLAIMDSVFADLAAEPW
jgi:hypothetical protein